MAAAALREGLLGTGFGLVPVQVLGEGVSCALRGALLWCFGPVPVPAGGLVRGRARPRRRTEGAARGEGVWDALGGRGAALFRV